MKRYIIQAAKIHNINYSNKYICRNFNAPSRLFDTTVSEHKNDSPLLVEPKKNLETDRDLILEVLNTVPTQREVQSYLKRFTPSIKTQKTSSKNTITPQQETSTKPQETSTKSQETAAAAATTTTTTSSASIDSITTKSSNAQAKEQSKLLLSAQKAEFVDSLFATRFEHIALIKLQGPFVPLNLNYVAKTLVHMQRLGLMSIVVLDNDEWRELMREGPSSFAKLRHWMVENATDISQAIENCGGRAIPIYNGIFSVKDKKSNNNNGFLSTDPKIDVSLSWLQSTLKLGQIPIILPIASNELSIQKTLSPNDGMIALTKALSNLPKDNSLNIKNPQLEPMRIIVINEEGGVPAEDRRGSHVFINIQQEYDDIKESYKVNPQWKLTHPTGLENFEMIKSCLEICPSTTSAIMAPSFSPTGLISNLITDKPLFSSSLPLNARTTPSTSTTVIRYGLQVYYHHSLSNINIPSLRSLIEGSFDRKLEVDEYVKRLKERSREIIVVGGYQGAAIVTIEDYGIAYLDKFAVAPNTRGIGVADILWKQLQLRFPNLLWRSRDDNVINKWYFERSHGNLKVPNSNWIMFWHGDEAINDLDKCIKVCQKIPASFLPTKAVN